MEKAIAWERFWARVRISLGNLIGELACKRVQSIGILAHLFNESMQNSC